ncbi:MAG: zinc-ribbon domain-containing protein [Aristaeellaceae bacterium]
MRSIRPGWGESIMSGAVSVIVALVGVIWTIVAVSLGAGFMSCFGAVFIVIALINAREGICSAAARKRMSVAEVAVAGEEPDPLNERFGHQPEVQPQPPQAAAYCPYCGASVEADYAFCPRCGKALRRA